LHGWTEELHESCQITDATSMIQLEHLKHKTAKL
jgi:hypothetical protein